MIDESRASCRSGHHSALSGTSVPVEHVKTHCPALLAALVAIARAPKDDQAVNDRTAVTTSQRRPDAARWPDRS